MSPDRPDDSTQVTRITPQQFTAGELPVQNLTGIMVSISTKGLPAMWDYMLPVCGGNDGPLRMLAREGWIGNKKNQSRTQDFSKLYELELRA